MDDQQIVELFWRRDPAAIEQIQERYGSYCFAIAHRILDRGEDAEEAVSDAMFAAWNAMRPTGRRRFPPLSASWPAMRP